MTLYYINFFKVRPMMHEYGIKKIIYYNVGNTRSHTFSEKHVCTLYNT